MTEELKMIMNLMDKPFDINSLKQLKQIVEKNIDPKYVKEIIETDRINKSAQFLVSSRTMKVNYNRMLKFLEETKEIFEQETFTSKEKNKKMIKLVMGYRIFLHELHHSKQTYNTFDTYEEDIETEIIRIIYNIDKEDYVKQLETTEATKIIEEKTLKANTLLAEYSKINPIERKAEIESYKKIIEIMKPVKDLYPEVSDYMHMQLLANMLNGYNKYGVPFQQLIQIMNIKKIPYNNKKLNEIIITNKATEIEKMKLGLNIKQDTIIQTEKKLQKLLEKY